MIFGMIFVMIFFQLNWAPELAKQLVPSRISPLIKVFTLRACHDLRPAGEFSPHYGSKIYLRENARIR